MNKINWIELNWTEYRPHIFLVCSTLSQLLFQRCLVCSISFSHGRVLTLDSRALWIVALLGAMTRMLQHTHTHTHTHTYIYIYIFIPLIQSLQQLHLNMKYINISINIRQHKTPRRKLSHNRRVKQNQKKHINRTKPGHHSQWNNYMHKAYSNDIWNISKLEL